MTASVLDASALLAYLRNEPGAEERAALLTLHTRAAGLFLADRICLALAGRMDVPAITADRAWEAVAATIGIQVELIR